MAMEREKAMQELEHFWRENLRFWENELGVDSDLSKEPAIRSLKEMCSFSLEFSPNYPFGTEEIRLNPEDVKEFIKYRKMDIWGSEYESHRLYGKWD